MGTCDVESRFRLRRNPSHHDQAADALRVWWDAPPVMQSMHQRFEHDCLIQVYYSDPRPADHDAVRQDLLHAAEHLLDELVEQVPMYVPSDWDVLLNVHVEHPLLDVDDTAAVMVVHQRLESLTVAPTAPPVMSVRASVSHLVAA